MSIEGLSRKRSGSIVSKHFESRCFIKIATVRNWAIEVVNLSHAPVQDPESEKVWPTLGKAVGKPKQPNTRPPSASSDLGGCCLVSPSSRHSSPSPVTAVMTKKRKLLQRSDLAGIGRQVQRWLQNWVLHLNGAPPAGPVLQLQLLLPILIPFVSLSSLRKRRRRISMRRRTSKTESNHQESQDVGSNGSASGSQDQEPIPPQESSSEHSKWQGSWWCRRRQEWWPSVVLRTCCKHTVVHGGRCWVRGRGGWRDRRISEGMLGCFLISQSDLWETHVFSTAVLFCNYSGMSEFVRNPKLTPWQKEQQRKQDIQEVPQEKPAKKRQQQNRIEQQKKEVAERNPKKKKEKEKKVQDAKGERGVWTPGEGSHGGSGAWVQGVLQQSQLRQRTPLQGEGFEGSTGFDSGAFTTPKTQRFSGLSTYSNQPRLISTFRRWEICRAL